MPVAAQCQMRRRRETRTALYCNRQFHQDTGPGEQPKSSAPGRHPSSLGRRVGSVSLVPGGRPGLSRLRSPLSSLPSLARARHPFPHGFADDHWSAVASRPFQWCQNPAGLGQVLDGGGVSPVRSGDRLSVLSARRKLNCSGGWPRTVGDATSDGCRLCDRHHHGATASAPLASCNPNWMEPLSTEVGFRGF